MVKLSFTAYVPALLPKVWQYFSEFENLPMWDPNTTQVILKERTKNKIGQKYDVTTLFNGKTQEMEYTMTKHQQMKAVIYEGQNTFTRTVDEIYFEEKDQGTNVTYSADISFKHVFKIVTPFVKEDLHRLAQIAEKGFRQKSKQMFGQANMK